MRKIGDTYYFVYSSMQNHELCYATSKYPDRDFVFGGSIVSNGDVGINGREEKDRLNMTGTTHGSIENINGQWYVFYHRLTHKSDYSRQACAEKITIKPGGSIDQVEITSCGLNGGALIAQGSYPAGIACNITNGNMPHGCNSIYTDSFPNVTNSGDDRYIGEIADGTLLGYKYFSFENAKNLSVLVRGSGIGTLTAYCDMGNTKIAEFVISPYESWTSITAPLNISDGIYPLYFIYKGAGMIDLKTITFNE